MQVYNLPHKSYLVQGDIRKVDWNKFDTPQLIVTSIPYWGKRRYPIDNVWLGDDSLCSHSNITKGLLPPTRRKSAKEMEFEGRDGKTAFMQESGPPPDICVDCGGRFSQLGQEENPQLFVDTIAEILSNLPLNDDGVMFVNVDDTYVGCKGKSGRGSEEKQQKRIDEGKSITPAISQAGGGKGITLPGDNVKNMKAAGLKQKDMALVPERFAIAMLSRGWYVRSRIIWNKTNTLPQLGGDRLPHNYETIWQFAKSKMAKYDRDAGRKMNDVWNIPIASGSSKVGKHIARMPVKLAERLILLASSRYDVVLDPFSGSGTTTATAAKLGRRFVGVDLDTRIYDFHKERMV